MVTCESLNTVGDADNTEPREDEKMSLPPRVYADFHNADQHGRLRLNCHGTMEDLERQRLSLHEGMQLRLHMEDVETIGKVTFSAGENLWVAVIDWSAIDRSEGA